MLVLRVARRPVLTMRYQMRRNQAVGGDAAHRDAEEQQAEVERAGGEQAYHKPHRPTRFGWRLGPGAIV